LKEKPKRRDLRPTGGKNSLQEKMIDGRRGRWCLISYAGEVGWAFDVWLIY
jgi:hypothetical protein